jgi:hypothetical protein
MSTVEYVVIFVGNNDKNQSHWMLWNRLCEIFNNIGHECKWMTHINDVNKNNNDDNEKTIFFVRNHIDNLKLIDSGKVNKNDIIFQKLEQKKTNNNGWDWTSYKTVENLYDEGYNIYGFTNSLEIDNFPEKKRIIEKLNKRIIIIKAGGSSFDSNKIKNCVPVMEKLKKEMNVLMDNKKYIELLEKSKYIINYQEHFQYYEIKDKLKNYAMCPILHTDLEREQKILNENFYNVFISGRFGICDNMTAVEIFGEEIKDICTEDPEEYYEKSIYYLEHPEEQLKYIETIQNKIKKKYNYSTQFDIFLNNINKNIIVSITNNKYFEGCLTLIKSTEQYAYDVTIFYYDLDEILINILKNIKNVTVIDFNNIHSKKFDVEHTKGYFLKTKLLLYCYKNIKKNILYLDSTINLKKNIDNIFEIINNEGFFCIDHSDRSSCVIINYNNFSSNFIEKYSVDHEILKKKQIKSGFFGFNNTKISKKLSEFMFELKEMNIEENYLEPKFLKKNILLFHNENADIITRYNDIVNTYKNNIVSKYYNGDRQDQTILSYLCAKYNLNIYESKIYKYSIDKGSSKNNYNKQNTIDTNIIINKLLNNSSYFYDENSIENEYSRNAYSSCHRMNHIFYDDICFKKMLSIICVTLGKRDFEKYLNYINELEKKYIITLIIIDFSGNLINIINDNKYSNLDIVYLNKKLSLTDSFKESINHVKTEYAMWLNDDDYIINKNFLNIFLENIFKHNDTDIFYGKGYYNNFKTHEKKNAYVNSKIEQNATSSFEECYGMLQPATFFKSNNLNVFNKIYYKNIFDVEFFINCKNKKFKFIDFIISEATINNDTITDNNKYSQLISHVHLLIDNDMKPTDSFFNRLVNSLINENSRLTTSIKLSKNINDELNNFIKNYCNFRTTKTTKQIIKKQLKLNILNKNSEEFNLKYLIESSFLRNNDLNDKKVLILGNGPSCKNINFHEIDKNTITLGMNSAYRYWDTIDWYPDIYVSLDPVVVLDHAENINILLQNKKIKLFFLNDNILNKFPEMKSNDKIIFLSDVHYKFHLFNNGMLTTGAYSIRLIIFMGYYNIDFIGIDCDYINKIKESEELENNKLIIKEEPDTNQNYFFDFYQKKGDVYQIPNVNKDFHLRSVNSVQNDIINMNIDLNINNLTNNKKILL